MKKLLLILTIPVFGLTATAQSFLNGDFENHTAVDCAYNMTNDVFNATIPNVFSFGVSEEPDLHTDNCYVTPQNGDWCAGLATSVAGYDALAVKFSELLTVGEEYELRFWTYGNPTFNPLLDSLRIGASFFPNQFGDELDVLLPMEFEWSEHIINFVATAPYEYITIEIKSDFDSGWAQIDNFSITDDFVSVRENRALSEVSAYPNPTQGIFTVETGQRNTQLDLTVQNTTGQVVLQQSFPPNGKVQIDLSAFSKGVYNVQLMMEGEVQMIQIVRQ